MSKNKFVFADSKVVVLDSFSRFSPNHFVTCSVQSTGLFKSKIVDDSSFVPNSEFLRSQIGKAVDSSHSVYDFVDGKDNGFTPALRGLGYDRAEVDSALQSVVDSAKEKIVDSEFKDRQKKSTERAENILKSIESSLDSGQSSSGQSSSGQSSSGQS